MSDTTERKTAEALNFVAKQLGVASEQQSYGTIQISIQAGVPEMASVKWQNRLGDNTDEIK